MSTYIPIIDQGRLAGAGAGWLKTRAFTSLFVLLIITSCRSKDAEDTSPIGVDDSAVGADADGDGISAADGDCDDSDPSINPYSTDLVGDGVDQNCDGVDGLDADGDGVASEASGGEDCDDGDGDVNPGAAELCDRIDNDCDGTIDEEGEAVTVYPDADGDGYGDDDAAEMACDVSDGYASVGGDCDDGDADLNPSAEELCDGIDNDCDGEIDDGSDELTDWYADGDGDGYGDSEVSETACAQPSGYVADDEDCDDGDASVNPGAEELCDGLDNDCDGLGDDADPDAEGEATWYHDGDSDGFGDPDDVQIGCDPPADHVSDGSDCDDSDADVNPDATEVCDGDDDNCDGLVDDDDPAVVVEDAWHPDADGDGYGDSSVEYSFCEGPTGTVAEGGDCDDSDDSINPGATEVCDDADVDEDCDGYADDNDPDASGLTTWYVDTDGDGYGTDTLELASCDQPSGFVADNTDCNDATADVSPAAEEVWYDGDDGDCDGLSDYDADYDGYASDAWGGDDCDDDDDEINVSASEIWYDGVDQDCDGASDYDADGDAWDSTTYGGEDCDDSDLNVYPGAPESDSGKDNDCDGDIEQRPEAAVSYDASTSTLLHCDALYLDGSGSSDPDEDALTYDWSLTSAPGSSTRATEDIAETTDEQPVFYPDIAGTYAFSLTVTDEGGAASEAAALSLSVSSRPTNTPPVVDPGEDQVSSESTSCTLSGYDWTCDDCSDVTFTMDPSGTEDSDGDPLSYSWTILDGESYAELSGADEAEAQVTVYGISSEYGTTDSVSVELEVEVTDCYGTSSSDTVTVTLECTGS